MIQQLKKVVLRWWSRLFANNDTDWRRNTLILFHCIQLGRLLLWNVWIINSGLILWKHGWIPEKWLVSSSQPNSCLVYATLARALITCKLYLMQETCEKNKENRELVKYHQTTGSRSYMVVIDNLVSKPWFSCSCIVWSN